MQIFSNNKWETETDITQVYTEYSIISLTFIQTLLIVLRDSCMSLSHLQWLSFKHIDKFSHFQITLEKIVTRTKQSKALAFSLYSSSSFFFFNNVFSIIFHTRDTFFSRKLQQDLYYSVEFLSFWAIGCCQMSHSNKNFAIFL